MGEMSHQAPIGSASCGYQEARERVERRRTFVADLVVYTFINSFLIVIWAIGGLGYFWPAWVLAGWGLLLALDAWNVYRRPISQTEIEKELRKGKATLRVVSSLV